MMRIRSYGPTLVLLVTAVLVMVAGPGLIRQIAWAQTDAQITLVKNELKNSPFLAQLSESFRQVAGVVEPSVVSIEVLSRENPRQRRGSMRQLPPGLEDFFGPRFQPPQQPREDEYDQYNPALPYGNGSGWVYDSAGHIITNNHVIDNADEIKVRFNDGSKYTATVVGVDPKTDVAVLQVDVPNLHPATIAADPVEQGDIVFAFGSPFRFDFSVSQGIVSAKGRQLGIIGQGGYENFIQTDAAINPGNSGGPLTNIYGQVIGMNTAIASRTGAFNGLGFAIPVKMVTEVADQLISQGKVSRGYLGIYIEDLDEKMAKTFGYDGKGVLVTDPIQGSPAAEAGIEAGDIIIRVAGKPVDSADALRYTIARFMPGSEVEMTIFRNGEQIARTVVLGELPTEASARVMPRSPEEEDAQEQGAQTLRKLGIEGISTFTQQMAERSGIQHQPGVVVEEVRPGSQAAAMGITRGTLITRVMGTNISSAQQLLQAVESYEAGTSIRVRVAQWDRERGRFLERFVLLELPRE